MKKVFIFITIITTISFLRIGCFTSLPPEKCSCYASGYTHEKLIKHINNGMDTSEVLKILGVPVSIYKFKNCHFGTSCTKYCYQYATRCNPKEGFCPEYFSATVTFDSTYHVIGFGDGVLD